jgi:signal transduction histidine kinase
MYHFGGIIGLCTQPSLRGRGTRARVDARWRRCGAIAIVDGGHRRCPCVVEMRLRLPENLPLKGKILTMNALDAPAERIIAEGRVIVAALSLLAFEIDPDLVAPHSSTAFKVFVAYAGIAVTIVVARVWRFPFGVKGYAAHALDIAILLILGALGQAGLLVAFFAFYILLAASLRWDWQAVLATAGIITFAIWAGGTLQTIRIGWPGENAAIVGALCALIAGGMLAYSNAVRERRRTQLTKLTEWPGPEPSQMRRPNLGGLLGHCANVLEAPRVLVLWEEAEEPFVSIAIWRHGEYNEARQMPGTYGNYVRSEEHAGSVFWTDDVTSTFASMATGPIRLEAPIVEDSLIHAFAIHSVASAPFAGTSCKGRVFILDRERWSDFQLQLVQIVASRLANALDREIMQRQAREAVAEIERARLIRDLHDGLLQSLTAAGLQIKLISDNESAETQERLELVRRLLIGEQRRIREVMGRTSTRNEREREVTLKTYLQTALAETAKHWNCKASLSVNPPDAMANAALCVHLSLMLGEAVANAVRHGQASMIRVSMHHTCRDLTVHIRDNGHGFGGEGFIYDAEFLTTAKLGPLSLRERVQELGGQMGMTSSSKGVELQIKLPLT